MKTKTFVCFITAVVLAHTLCPNAKAQCMANVLTTGLGSPAKIILARDESLVAETVNGPNTGRISIISRPGGRRRTLLDGMPAGFSSQNNDPAGPSGLFLRGNTLFVTISVGDAVINGAIPGSQIPNPQPSSPIFSSVLAIRLPDHKNFPKHGQTLTTLGQLALKAGATITLGHGIDRLCIRLVGDFPDYTPEPRPGEPNNVRPSNPFGVVVVDDDVYVDDASTNQVRTVDNDTGELGVLTSFLNVPNTRGFGPPVVEAVPDSIHLFDDQLLVTTLTGFPFPIGGAQVRTVDLDNGNSNSFITDLTSAIDVLPVRVSSCDRAFLTLEYSTDMLVPGMPGRLRYYASSTAAPQVVADCLITPTSMARDARNRKIYVTEISTGRVMQINE